MDSSSSPRLNGYPSGRSNTIGEGGTRTASHSRSSPSDGGREEDSMILHDGVDGIGVGSGGVIEFGNYGGGDGRGGLPSMPEGDDENVDYDHSQHHHHQHQHQQHPQQHHQDTEMFV